MVDIKTNLLKNRRTLSEKDYKREREYLRYSVVAVVLVVIVTVALSVWNLVLTNQLKDTEAAIASSNKDMQGLTKASSQQIYLKSRLNLITGFLKDRSYARESLQKIFSSDIPGAHIGSVAFESDTILLVGYVSNDIVALDKLVSYFEQDTGYFTQVVSRGLAKNKDGSYQMTLALTLPKGGK